MLKYFTPQNNEHTANSIETAVGGCAGDMLPPVFLILYIYVFTSSLFVGGGGGPRWV